MRTAKNWQRKLRLKKAGVEESNYRGYFFILALMAIGFGAHAQFSHTAGLALYQGGMFKQLKEQPVLTYSGLVLMEARYTRHTTGKAPWTAYHHYPQFEMGINYMNYGMPDIFGQFITVTTGLNYGLIGDRFRWSPGFGLGYSTRYNTPENRRNKAVSTRISFAVELDFMYRIPVGSSSLMDVVVGFRHASNGNIKKPNYGMNVVLGGISFHYEVGSGAATKISQEDHKDISKLRYTILYSSGWKDPRVFRDNRLYHIHVLSLYAAYRFSNINSFSFGFDGFVDSSQYEEYINQKEEDPPFGKDFDRKQLAFTFGNIVHFDDLSIIMSAGVYLYRPYKFRPFSYQRYGFQYTLGESIVLQAALKAYFGSADAMEFGMGFRL